LEVGSSELMTMNDDCTVRALTSGDFDLVCAHRTAMFTAMGRSTAVVEAMAAPFRSWLALRIDDGRYFGFVAEHCGRPVGGIGLMIFDWPPHPQHPTQDERGYILNLFVQPDHRRKGVARP
jgi:GNAT superfamily N-acetyltransferase